MKLHSKFKEDFYNFLVGFFMGSANVIPGVSGGTMLFIMGAFNKLVDTLRTIGSVETAKMLFKGDFKGICRRIDWRFLLFLVIGLALVIATRPLCRKFLVSKQEKTNVDAVVGKACLVTEEIRNIDEVGEVKLGGLCWSARAADGRVIAVGEQVTVKEVQGVKLIVE